MILNGNNGNSTLTGLAFEQQVTMARKDGINLSKTKLKQWVKAKGLKLTDYLSWEFQPDEAYYLPESNEVIIYEKNINSLLVQ